MRPRRIWRAGNSLVLTIEYREAKRLDLHPGDLVAASLTPVEAALRGTEQFRSALSRAIARTMPALLALRERDD